MSDSNNTGMAETRAKVLYIEDDPGNLKLMQDIFSEFIPYDLVYAENGEAGIALAKEQLPNLVMVDINMHGLGGYQALEILKADEKLAEVPVFAVSGDVLPEQIEKALESGFSEYITKPFNVIEFIDMVKAYLK